MEEIEVKHPEIPRTELIARESNEKAIGFYKSFGFKIEEKMEKRIDRTIGRLEADIPRAVFCLARYKPVACSRI